MTTGASGEIALQSEKTKDNLQDAWCFPVTDVSASGAARDAVAAELCEPWSGSRRAD